MGKIVFTKEGKMKRVEDKPIVPKESSNTAVPEEKKKKRKTKQRGGD